MGCTDPYDVHNISKMQKKVDNIPKLKEMDLRGRYNNIYSSPLKYNRLACYNFQGDEGELFDLTDIKTWISLIHKNKNGVMINNINGKYAKSVEAIRSIIPCMSSAISMARECEEVIFIPHKRIEFNIIENYDNILRNNPEEKSILTSLSYDNQTIDALLEQLKSYDIERKQLVSDQLLKLKIS